MALGDHFLGQSCLFSKSGSLGDPSLGQSYLNLVYFRVAMANAMLSGNSQIIYQAVYQMYRLYMLEFWCLLLLFPHHPLSGAPNYRREVAMSEWVYPAPPEPVDWKARCKFLIVIKPCAKSLISMI